MNNLTTIISELKADGIILRVARKKLVPITIVSLTHSESGCMCSHPFNHPVSDNLKDEIAIAKNTLSGLVERNKEFLDTVAKANNDV